MSEANTIKADTTVRELVVEYPQTLKVFEKHGIDYCCGGGHPLSEAATVCAVSFEDLKSELEQAMTEPPPEEGAERNWSSVSLTDLVDHILETHHVFMKEQLPRLEHLLTAVVRAHGPRHGDVLMPLQKKYASLKSEIEVHLEKEEQVLFPALRQLESKTPQVGVEPSLSGDALRAALGETVREHETVGATLDSLRKLTADYALPGDACPTFAALYRGLPDMERDLHRHIHLENNILFPSAKR